MPGDIRILTHEPDSETATFLAQLAEEARQGSLVGVIVVAFYRRWRPAQSNRRYSLKMTGLAARDPTLASGALGACKVLVDELALQEAGLLDH